MSLSFQYGRLIFQLNMQILSGCLKLFHVIRSVIPLVEVDTFRDRPSITQSSHCLSSKITVGASKSCPVVHEDTRASAEEMTSIRDIRLFPEQLVSNYGTHGE